MLQSYKKFFFLSLVLFLFSFAHISFAANLNFSPSSGSYKIGDVIKVRVVLASPSESANAVSGKILFSNDKLSLTSISKTGSLISLWAVEPSYSNSSGTADMEGVILSGYSGSNGTIITLSFKAKESGTANIRFSSSSVLANDGQGTNILSSSGQANFSISQAEQKITPKPTTPVAQVEDVKVNPTVHVEELKKKDELDTTVKFLISSVGKKVNSTYKIEIDNQAYPWTDQTSGIFTTPELKNGKHTLKVSMDTVNNDVVSSTLNFSISSLSAPSFTEYSENVKEKEYIVIKGIADPNVDVVIDSRLVVAPSNQVIDKETKVRSDERGFFVYTSEKASQGMYSISAYTISPSGVKSEKTSVVTVDVISSSSSFLANLSNTFSVLIPVVGLIIFLIIIILWGWYKVLHVREHLHTKLIKTRSLVSKSFDILDDDIKEQIKILKKVKDLRPLTSSERAFIEQFKRDIEDAQKVITTEIKEVDN